MDRSLKDQAVIVGIGQTEFSKNSGRSELQLASEAVKAAILDAGLKPEQIDGLTSFTLDSSDEIEVARSVGIGDLTMFSKIGYGGGAAVAVVAAMRRGAVVVVVAAAVAVVVVGEGKRLPKQTRKQQRQAGAQRQLVIDLSGKARVCAEVDQIVLFDKIAPRPAVCVIVGGAAAKYREAEKPVVL